MKLKLQFYLIVLLASCAPKQENVSKKYFDIKGLFTNQINVLLKEKPVFVKKVEINSEKETKEFATIDWKKELDPFMQMDLNKAAYQKSYEIIETDSSTNYQLKKGEKLPISSILICKKQNKISSIEISANDENMLYSWEKELKAYFENSLLKEYVIKGEQKILIFDKETFQIVGIKK